MPQVRFGIIGCGAIAQRRHIPELHKNPNAVVVAIADPVVGRAASIGDPIGAAAYRDYKKMLDSEQLDAVAVCTPNALHAEQSIEAFKHKLHVLVEKPMATTRADAKKMIAAGKRARKFLMIGMNQRLMPAHVKAKQVLDAGTLGKVLAFETSFKHPGPDHWSVDGPQSWFFKKPLAGMGVCGDLGVHKADLMRYLLGEEIVKVTGFIKQLDKKLPNGKPIPLDDNAFITMQSATGIIGTMNISWTHYGRFEDNGTILYCEKGVLRMGDDPTYGVQVDFANGQKERYVVGAVATNEKQVGSGISAAFTRAILTKKAPEIDGDEGYKALSIILTCFDAAKSGKTERVH